LCIFYSEEYSDTNISGPNVGDIEEMISKVDLAAGVRLVGVICSELQGVRIVGVICSELQGVRSVGVICSKLQRVRSVGVICSKRKL